MPVTALREMRILQSWRVDERFVPAFCVSDRLHRPTSLLVGFRRCGTCIAAAHARNDHNCAVRTPPPRSALGCRSLSLNRIVPLFISPHGSRHGNIVTLLRVVAGSRRGSIFFVFEYAEHDLVRPPCEAPALSPPLFDLPRRQSHPFHPSAPICTHVGILHAPCIAERRRITANPNGTSAGPPARRAQGQDAVHGSRGEVPRAAAAEGGRLPARPLGDAPRPQAQQPSGADAAGREVPEYSQAISRCRMIS